MRHALRRLWKRHGLGIVDYAEAIDQIQTNRATLVEKQSHRVRLFDVELRGRTIRVVYDRTRGQLMTVLPEATNDD